MSERKKITINTLREMMEKGEQITMLTAYDYPLALLEEKAGVEIILCGDSLGMTVYGYETTLPVTLEMCLKHTAAVRRGAPTAYLVGDMPYMTYQTSKEEAIRNAGRFMAETGCDCVKLEGGAEMAETINAMVKATIPVFGHIGLTPQSLAQMGGFKAQGRDAATAEKLVEDARVLEEAGISLLLVEGVPPEVLEVITERAKIPVISLGSGEKAHGQCLIVHDILGFFDRFIPKFAKRYANVSEVIIKAVSEFVNDVKTGAFPTEAHTYKMKAGEADKFRQKMCEK